MVFIKFLTLWRKAYGPPKWGKKSKMQNDTLKKIHRSQLYENICIKMVIKQ